MARFTPNGIIAARWLTTLPADPAAPTQVELDAGVDLIGNAQDEEAESLNGFEVSNNVIPTPGLASNRVGSVAGEQTYPASTMTFYKDDTVEVIYSALPDLTTGFVALMHDGQAAGKEVDIFPATVTSRNRRVGTNVAAMFDVNLALTVPYLGGTQAA